MLILTEAGWKTVGGAPVAPKTTPAIERAEREWRNAWNFSAREFNALRARAIEVYGRMTDTNELPMIAEHSFRCGSAAFLR